MTYNVIVFGGGRIAISHIPHILSNNDVSSVTVIEPSLVNRLFLKLIFDIDCYSNINKIDISVFNVACILTPPKYHKFYSDICAEHSIPFFVEKPVALSFKDSDSILKKCISAGIYSQAGYVYRFHPVIKKFVSLISQANEKPKKIILTLNANVNNENSNDSWRNSDIRGAGCIYDFGSHLFDLSVLLAGDSVSNFKHISTFKESILGSKCTDKFSSVFEINGVPNHVACNWANPEVRKATLFIKVEFGNFNLETDLFNILSNKNDLAAVRTNITSLNTNVDYYLRGEDFSRQWEFFFKSISLGHKPNINPVVDLMLDAAYEA
jgi:scyllo-inositol 2-dehydrogenase (NADP+)